jgi:two-component system, chemotaxis family, sensor kinase CheA
LIFLPGFSTKEIITDISGRGVGLDVVKANLDALKGSVSVTSILGQSTTFTLRVPLTLTSELGLMVSTCGQAFVIPMNGIERVFTLRTDEIVEIEASQTVLLEGHPVPLRILADILKFEKKEIANPDCVPIIILKNARKVVAILVDEIIGEREIVIKPLQPPASNVPCVIGGTLSGKGQVIVVLSASDLIEAAVHSGQMTRVSIQDKTDKEETRPRILVVDDSITTRTLEKNILESNHYQVTLAVNGKEAWDILQKESFSLLITDVSMPIMDGFTLTERVKQSNQLRDLPVIIVTSLGSDAEKKKGAEVGANAYIVKNEFESDVLLEVVAQLV